MTDKKAFTTQGGQVSSSSPQEDEGRASKAGPARAAKGRQPELPQVLKDPPTLEQLEKELKRIRYRDNFRQVLRNTLFSLIVVAAVSALIAVLLLPVLQLHGTSMTPTLQEGDIIVALNAGSCKPGELIAFYYNNNVLIKRVIASPGDWITIEEDGTVSVNGEVLNEPYISQPALGSCDLNFPYQVPDGRYFVMGDHRETSIDSRSSVMGCVSREMVIGRIILRIWPLQEFRIFGSE